VKRLLALALALLAGCADAPAPPPRQGPVVADHGAGVEDALKPEVVQLRLEEKPRSTILLAIGGHMGDAVIVAPDVTGRTSLEESCRDTVADADLLLRRFALREGLHVTRVGEIEVVSSASLGEPAPPGDRERRAMSRAWSAPAEAWFALLERATGRRLEHGDAPMTIATGDVPLDDLLRASALVSRIRAPGKELAHLAPTFTLRSGRTETLDLLAIVANMDHPLLLVNGTVAATGEEVAPGVVFKTFDQKGIMLRAGEDFLSLGRDEVRVIPVRY
jgi:hypothetical protein